jgi:hypothetical protein
MDIMLQVSPGLLAVDGPPDAFGVCKDFYYTVLWIWDEGIEKFQNAIMMQWQLAHFEVRT